MAENSSFAILDCVEISANCKCAICAMDFHGLCYVAIGFRMNANYLIYQEKLNNIINLNGYMMIYKFFSNLVLFSSKTHPLNERIGFQDERLHLSIKRIFKINFR